MKSFDAQSGWHFNSLNRLTIPEKMEFDLHQTIYKVPPTDKHCLQATSLFDPW